MFHSILTLLLSIALDARPNVPAMSVADFCKSVNQAFQKNQWTEITCNPKDWKVGGYSIEGRPLLYAEYGDSSSKDPQTTIMFCGVHGDESPTLYLCFALNQEAILKDPKALKGRHVVIAPLANPDGFLREKPSRTNARGIDLNRNFPTEDWAIEAHKEWTKKFQKDPRKYPGVRPNSEPETQFQLWLISKYKADKILTAHSPLRFIDYDGPADQRHFGLVRRENRARFLAMNISKNAHVPLVDYRFYPGSLGNYAGQEVGIPTYTIELATSDSRRAKKMWDDLKHSLEKAVRFIVTDDAAITSTEED